MEELGDYEQASSLLEKLTKVSLCLPYAMLMLVEILL